MKLLQSAALLGLVLLGSACASQQKTTMDRLRESVEGYNHAFRWKNYERAAMFVPKDLRGAFIAAYEDDESSLQVEDYQVRTVDLHDDKSATVSVRLRYLMLPDVTVQNRTLVQHWADVDGQWILETEENSVRKLDPAKPPADPAARQPEPDPEPGFGDGETEVEVERPGDEP